MTGIDEKMLQALGLDPSTPVRSVEKARWADSGVGFGFTTMEPVSFFARPENVLSERIALQSFEEATGGQLRRHRETGGVAYVRVPGGRLRSVGASTTTSGDTLVIDAREESVAVRIDLEWFTYLLLFSGNTVEVLTIDKVSELFGSTQVSPAATDDFLFGKLSTEDWLRDEVRVRSALPSSWMRATAAGLAARLWRSADPASIDVTSLRKLGSPASRALSWFASLPEPERSLLEHSATRYASELLAGLEVAVRDAEAEPAEPPESLHQLALRRDDAECVVAVLPPEARVAAEGALRRMDRVVEAHWTSLSAYAWPNDLRLRAVLRQEPEAWWGRLAGS